MLTLDLLRAKIVGDEIRPVYLTISGGKKYLMAAETILKIHRQHVGSALGELNSALGQFTGGSADYKVYRGLAKVLEEFCEVGRPSEVDAEDLRMKVFEAAAAHRPIVRSPDLIFHTTAGDALDAISGEIGLAPDEIEKGLYADLKENQLLVSLDPLLDAVGLIERYNTALAQALLYRAIQMRVEVYDNYRQVFQFIKLARLMHTIERIDGGYLITLDGPLSLVTHTERYGVGMARLLPALLRCKRWQMEAVVNTSFAGHRIFKLGNWCGLTSHYTEQASFDSSAEEAFYEKFSRNKKSKWTIEREGGLLDLKGTVMIPDFAFRHPDGREVYLEIVGFWRPEYLEKKLEKIRRAGSAPLVLAVPAGMNCSFEDYDGPVVHYKTRLLLKDVLPAIESAYTNCA
ncbi:MAG: DUF790 family protein [Armatimonadetes bacterium]|nr:DUF790 family protein [Armatimonadota bacterium]